MSVKDKAVSLSKMTLREEARFPNQVFKRNARCFLFFDSDNVFGGKFWKDIELVTSLDSSGIILMQSLCGSGMESRFFEPDVPFDKFIAEMESGGPERGWIYGKITYTILSDTGDWYIYGEGINDISVIAFFSDKFDSLMPELNNRNFLHVKSFDDDDEFSIIGAPGTDWRRCMLRNYGGI